MHHYYMKSSLIFKGLVTEIVFATVCFVHQSSHARKLRLAFEDVFHLSARALGAVSLHCHSLLLACKPALQRPSSRKGV